MRPRKHVGNCHRASDDPEYAIDMADTHVAIWDVENDVLEPYYIDSDSSHRTIIAAAGHAPPRNSIVICGNFFVATSPTVFAIGKVRSVQSASTARVRATVEPFFMFGAPIPVEQLRHNLDPDVSAALDGAMDQYHLFPSVFDPHPSAALLDALRRTSTEASRYIDELLRGPVRLAADDIRPREARDATTMAIRFARLSDTAQLRTLRDPTARAEAAFGVAFSTHQMDDHEDDLLAADLRRFDDSATLRDITGSIVEVADSNTRLIVMNVNRKRLEEVSGVDLVYYDETEDKAVAVQYKRMQRSRSISASSSHSEWIYHRKSELLKQLRLMEEESFSTERQPTADEWRLSSSPNFFKFTWPQRLRPDSKMLIPGMYVPDEYIRLGIREGKFDDGPSGGFQITRKNTRHFTSETFVELVRRCWLGTRRTDRSRLVEYARAVAEEHQVVLALQSRRAS